MTLCKVPALWIHMSKIREQKQRVNLLRLKTNFDVLYIYYYILGPQ